MNYRYDKLNSMTHVQTAYLIVAIVCPDVTHVQTAYLIVAIVCPDVVDTYSTSPSETLLTSAAVGTVLSYTCTGELKLYTGLDRAVNMCTARGLQGTWAGALLICRGNVYFVCTLFIPA